MPPVAPTSSDSGQPAYKIVRRTKDGKRAQVQFTNGRLGWVDLNSASSTTAASMPPTSPKIVSHNFRPDATPPPSTPLPNTTSGESTPSARTGYRLPDLPESLKGLGNASTLSEREARDLEPMLEMALPDILELVDKSISASLKHHPQVTIWSDMDDADIHFTAQFMTNAGKKHKQVAVAVRVTVTLHAQGKIFMILAPRFYKTWQVYNQFGFEMPGGKDWRRRNIHAARNYPTAG